MTMNKKLILDFELVWKNPEQKIQNAISIMWECEPWMITSCLQELHRNKLFDMFCEKLKNPENKHLISHVMYYLKYLRTVNKQRTSQLLEIAKNNHKLYIEATIDDPNALPYALSLYNERDRQLIINNL